MKSTIRRLVVIATSLVIGGCTTMAYERPAQPDSAVATITSEKTMIASIDGKAVPYSGGNFATFKVLPGVHAVVVKLNDIPLWVGPARYSESDLTVVFSAEAGRAYIIRPAYVGNTWHPEISERLTTNGPSSVRK
nr:hypothetical protein [uncultured Pseudomonas sp.]